MSDIQPTPEPTEIERGGKDSLRIILRAVREGWQIPEAMYDIAPRVAASMLADKTLGARDRLRAIEILTAMARDKVSAAIALDKIQRLDGGEATDRIVVTPELQQRAEALIRRLEGDAA